MAADNSAVLLFELPTYGQPVVYRAVEEDGKPADGQMSAAAATHMHMGGKEGKRVGLARQVAHLRFIFPTADALMDLRHLSGGGGADGTAVGSKDSSKRASVAEVGSAENEKFFPLTPAPSSGIEEEATHAGL